MIKTIGRQGEGRIYGCGLSLVFFYFYCILLLAVILRSAQA